MPKNAYAKELKRKALLRQEIIRQWEAQFCLDMITIVLADSKVMGKDTFGPKRLARIGQAFNKRYDECITALSSQPDNDYMRENIDRRLRQIMGDETIRWQDRYKYWGD